MPRRPRTFVAACLRAAAVSGCTSIGFHDSDNEREARELIADAWNEKGRTSDFSRD
jgi:hypothetical protein